MDWIMKNSFKKLRIESKEDRIFILKNRDMFRDIGGYKPDLYSIGEDYYLSELEDVDPNHCIRDNFGYEAIGRGVIEEENWIQLPSGAYVMEFCIFDCKECPYGFNSEEECKSKAEYIQTDKHYQCI